MKIFASLCASALLAVVTVIPAAAAVAPTAPDTASATASQTSEDALQLAGCVIYPESGIIHCYFGDIFG